MMISYTLLLLLLESIPKQQSCEKRVHAAPRKAMVKKDVKSKVAAMGEIQGGSQEMAVHDGRIMKF